MKHGRLIALIFASIVAIVLAHADVQKPTTQPSQILKHLTEDSTGGDGARLDGGIVVKLTRSEGTVAMAIQSATVTHTDRFIRSVEVYVSQPIPAFTIVADCFASNEDRLVVYDMSGNLTALELKHDGEDPYTHMHFEVEGMNGDAVKIKEIEWAGDDPPREREIILEATKERFQTTYGKWKKS